MTNPYTTTPPAPGPRAPRWARKRYVLPALALALLAGMGIGAGENGGTEPTAAKPRPTVTVTATETVRVTETVTAAAEAAEADDTDDSTTAYYGNCSQARAAGVTPLHVGDPGYGRHLDRDGDGTACE